MATKDFDQPRFALVPLAVSPETRELVRQLKEITGARNVDVFLRPLLEKSIRDKGHKPEPSPQPIPTKSRKKA